MNLGKAEHATRDLSAALAVQPRNPMLLKERARAWFAADQYVEAIRDLNQIAEVSRDGNELLEILKVHLSFAAGKIEEGVANLKRLEPASDRVGALLNVAEAYLVINPEEALRILGKIKTLKGRRCAAHRITQHCRGSIG